MKIIGVLSAVVIVTMITGCASTPPEVELSRFSFEYGGKKYDIQCTTPRSQEGYNLLMQREGNNILIKAIDKEQDGFLDEVKVGDISLENAQKIYREGITAATKQEVVKTRTFAREYRASDVLNKYILRSYILAIGEYYNRFSVLKKQGNENEIVLIDLNADGKLDKIEKGVGNLEQYQSLYQKVLEKGLDEQKVAKAEGMYQVIQ